MATAKTANADLIGNVEANLRAACARLVVSHGFFAGPVLRKRWIPSEAMAPTIGTDGRDLYYSPAWIAAGSSPECIGLLVHEACHDLGLHMFREQGRDIIVCDADGHMVKLWNIACDTQCNQVVADCGLSVPRGGVAPVKDSTAEAEYEKLAKKAKELPKMSCHCTMLPPQGADGQPLRGHAVKEGEAG